MGNADLVDRATTEVLKAINRMAPPSADDAHGKKTLAGLIAIVLDERGMLRDPEPRMMAGSARR
jgi:hypothetical protein